LELPLEELKAIIGADELNVKSEKVVWDGVLRWINHDKENRKGNIVELIKKVRLGLLDPKFVLENVIDHPYVAGNDECCAIIMDALKFLRGLETISQKERKIPDRELVRPRIQHETLFVITDWLWKCAGNYILMYDTRTNRWVEVEQFEPNVELTFYGTAVIGFNIYVIGGYDGHSFLNSCRCFNVVAKTWCELSPMHERRSRLSVTVLDGLVYAMGGIDGRSICKSAERYDHRTNRWSMIAPMNGKRMDASATTLNGKIYVVGGVTHNGCLNSAEVYDPEVNQWTSIANMISARSCLSCIAYRGHVYAIGGYNSTCDMRSGEKYNPTTNAWVQIPDMSHPRANFGIAVLDDTIFALDGNTRNSVECYDGKSNEWIAARDMNICAFHLSACVIIDLPNV
jgi:kelch-like protein 10